MLRVMVVNPGDEVGFPPRPCEVHSVAWKDFPKWIVDHKGALILIIDTDAPVPHPYDKNATLGVDRARQLINYALKGFLGFIQATQAVITLRSREASIAKYDRRIEKEKASG